jgi:hypothetical protein
MEKEIELFIENNLWITRYPEDHRLKELFGSTILPTSFPDTVPAEIVRREILQKNPGYRVVVRTSDRSDC